jgi:pectate lyase
MALTKVSKNLVSFPNAFVPPAPEAVAHLADGDTVRFSWGGTKEVAITRGQAITMCDDQSAMVGYAAYASTTGGAGQTIYWVVDERDVNESLSATEGTLRYCIETAEANGGGRIIFDPRLPLDIQLNTPIYVPSNVTLDAPGRNVRIFSDRTVSMLRIEPIAVDVVNIIIRRLKFVHVPAASLTQSDAIIVVPNNAAGTLKVDQVWIDECTTDRIEDGCIDVYSISDVPLACRITISRCVFRNTMRAHIFGSTLCAQASPGVAWCATSASQTPTILITLYRNVYESIAQRTPLVYSLCFVHSINNAVRLQYKTDDDDSYTFAPCYGIQTRDGGSALSEGDCFVTAVDPVITTYAAQPVTTSWVAHPSYVAGPGYLKVTNSVADASLTLVEGTAASVTVPPYSLTALVPVDTVAGRSAFFKTIAQGSGSDVDSAPKGDFVWLSTSVAEPDQTAVVALSYDVAGRFTKTSERDFIGRSPYSKGNALDSGSYTPTLSAGVNIASSTLYPTSYLRIGNSVTVSGAMKISMTATPATTSFEVNLPIVSDVNSAYDLGGTAAVTNTTGTLNDPIAIVANSTNNTAKFQMYWTGSAASDRNVSFQFGYLVE